MRRHTLALTILGCLALAAPIAYAASRSGGPGNDTINGTAKTDVLKGTGGSDHIYGHGGDDVIEGGHGNDY
ncbi:MAG: hypothetical protein ABI950_10670, partial [Solirubrobacteraceae bacterium]